jgi:aspartate racemase
MEGDFIKGRLEEKFNLEVLVPNEEISTQMNEIIFTGLPKRIVTEKTKNLYLDCIADLVQQGAEGVTLGCTELQFVLKSDDVDIPLFDTVALHARGVAQWAIDN